jgi:hypothetical protein
VSYSLYLCLLTHSDVKNILCYVFVLLGHIIRQHKKPKKMSNRDPTKQTGVNSGAREYNSCTFIYNLIELLIYFISYTSNYCLRLVYYMLPVSLECPFLIAPSVFSNIYLVSTYLLVLTSKDI